MVSKTDVPPRGEGLTSAVAVLVVLILIVLVLIVLILIVLVLIVLILVLVLVLVLVLIVLHDFALLFVIWNYKNSMHRIRCFYSRRRNDSEIRSALSVHAAKRKTARSPQKTWQRRKTKAIGKKGATRSPHRKAPWRRQTPSPKP